MPGASSTAHAPAIPFAAAEAVSPCNEDSLATKFRGSAVMLNGMAVTDGYKSDFSPTLHIGTPPCCRIPWPCAEKSRASCSEFLSPEPTGMSGISAIPLNLLLAGLPPASPASAEKAAAPAHPSNPIPFLAMLLEALGQRSPLPHARAVAGQGV
jgi:hypothetical protein